MRNKKEKQCNYFEDFEVVPWMLPFSSILQLPLLRLILSFVLYLRFYFKMMLYKVQKGFLHLDSC